MSSALSMIETVKRVSKEDTNVKHLNNLRLVRQRPDESSAFAEMSAKLPHIAGDGYFVTAIDLRKSTTL